MSNTNEFLETPVNFQRPFFWLGDVATLSIIFWFAIDLIGNNIPWSSEGAHIGSLGIELVVMSLRSAIFLAFISLLTWLTFFRSSKKCQWGFLLLLSLSMLTMQIVGNTIWRAIIEDWLVKEFDSWVPFATYLPIMWNNSLIEFTSFIHTPLRPFTTTGQISQLYLAMANILTLGGTLVPGAILSLYRKTLNYLIWSVAFFALQFIIQNILNLVLILS